ncbi:MAG: hypothetical protein PQJ59_02890 [Spirochaetales bacterium]|nr:hypothetical protein [Spirochaetales bacterium]
MKKFLVLFLAVAMSFMFFSCEEESSTDYSEVTDEVVMEVIIFGTYVYYSEDFSTLSSTLSSIEDDLDEATDTIDVTFDGTTGLTGTITGSASETSMSLSANVTLTITSLEFTYLDESDLEQTASISGSVTVNGTYESTEDATTYVESMDVDGTISGSFVVSGYDGISNISFSVSLDAYVADIDADDYDATSLMDGSITIDGSIYSLSDIINFMTTNYSDYE